MLTTLQNLFQCKILFIPGNHDPLVFLQNEPDISPDIINIHKKEFVLEVGLSIVGLGGSIPAYSDPEGKILIWNGFPYKCEE